MDTAIRKFRMMAYLWQAFTAEQMNRNGFGRRCYRYEEDWQTGTLSWKDLQTNQMRNEVRVPGQHRELVADADRYDRPRFTLFG